MRQNHFSGLLEEVDSLSHGWLWGVQGFNKEITADVVELAKELELEAKTEDVPKLV